MAEIEAAGIWPGKLVTEVKALEVFWPAEDYHQNYFARNPWQGYCQAVVAPKVAKFRKTFSDRLKKETSKGQGSALDPPRAERPLEPIR